MSDNTRINTSHFPDALENIKTMAKDMEDIVRNLDIHKQKLLRNWVGKGRNQFEKSYNVLLRKLEDGRNATWDIYEDLISAQETLLQADVNVAKASHK